MILNPRRKQIISSVCSMFHQSNLSKLCAHSNRPGDLLTQVGGAATHAYFQSQHFHFHHQNHNRNRNGVVSSLSLNSLSNVRDFHCNCTSFNGHNGADRDRSQSQSQGGQSHIDPEVKMKLDALKERLAQNVYFEKYKEKFLKLEIESPKELLAKLEVLDSRESKSFKSPSASGSSNAAKDKEKLKASSSPYSYTQTKTHSLSQVMEVDLLKDLEREDIIYLWQEFHRKKEGLIAAVMSSQVFQRMSDLASLYPLFVMPLPREEGYEFFFMQYLDKAFHFTPLLAYQLHKENAPECLRLINYTDLESRKDLVLMRGEYDKNILSPKEAHTMAVQVNFYFGETSESRNKLLEEFSKRPETFEHMNLIEELKKLQTSHPHLFELEVQETSSESQPK